MYWTHTAHVWDTYSAYTKHLQGTHIGVSGISRLSGLLAMCPFEVRAPLQFKSIDI